MKGAQRGGKAPTSSEGWNVVGGVDGKINTMSDCQQVSETDGGFKTILNWVHNAGWNHSSEA